MSSSARQEGRAASLPPRIAYAVFAAIVLIWGLNWPVMKIATSLVPPLWFAFLRFAIGAVCLFAVVICTGRFRWPDRRDLPVMITMPVFQMALYIGLISIGLLYVPAGRSAILAYTTPIWVLPAAAFVLKEPLTGLKLLAFMIGVAGILILVNPAAIDWSDGKVLFGNATLLLSAASWAVGILHARLHRWHLSPLQLAPLQMLATLPLLGIAAWIYHGPLHIHWPAELVYVLLYNGPLATAFTFWAILTVQRALPASTTALSFLVVPVWGLTASIWWLHEELPVSLVIGGALILAAVALVVAADRRRQRYQRHANG